MRVLVYYLVDGSQKKEPINLDDIEKEMDRIEKDWKDAKRFHWLPDRDAAIEILRAEAAEMYVDPFHFSWPFRRAFLEEQARCSNK